MYLKRICLRTCLTINEANHMWAHASTVYKLMLCTPIVLWSYLAGTSLNAHHIGGLVFYILLGFLVTRYRSWTWRWFVSINQTYSRFTSTFESRMVTMEKLIDTNKAIIESRNGDRKTEKKSFSTLYVDNLVVSKVVSIWQSVTYMVFLMTMNISYPIWILETDKLAETGMHIIDLEFVAPMVIFVLLLSLFYSIMTNDRMPNDEYSTDLLTVFQVLRGEGRDD